VRVVIAEDLALLRDGLTRIVTAYGFEVVEAVATGPDLRRALVTQRPELAIVDVRLPPTLTDEGLTAALDARRNVDALPVVVLSQHVEPLYAKELMSDGRGGVGYLLKDRIADVARFIESLRVVAAGGNVLDPEVVSQLLDRPAHRGPLSRLTDRERDVLALMAEGRGNTGIAERLFITEKAVSKHINGIFAKLELPPGADDHRRVRAVLTYLNS
jgi:DNA-binding NarL/FixJ family response regulator